MPLPPNTDPNWQKRLALESQLGMESGHESDYPAFRNVVRASLLRTLLKGAGLWERGRQNTRKPIMRETTLRFPSLPPGLEGLQILHLSDLHYPQNDPEFEEAITEFLTGVRTDLCLMTGDYRYGYFGSSAHVADKLARALSGITARYGTYAVLGNHDTSNMVAPLEAIGVTVLVNAGVCLNIQGADTWISGGDDPHRFQCDDLPQALQDAPDNAFKIALVHSPERYRQAEELGMNLYLCGHTHAGQVRLPLIGAPIKNAHCPRRMGWGNWQYRNMQGHTSAGLGVTDVPIRFNCPPEATKIILHR